LRLLRRLSSESLCEHFGSAGLIALALACLCLFVVVFLTLFVSLLLLYFSQGCPTRQSDDAAFHTLSAGFPLTKIAGPR
jgi:hypothetical protein